MSQMTTVILPEELKAALMAEAREKGISMAAIIRWALWMRYERQAQEAGLDVRIGGEGQMEAVGCAG